MIARVRFIDPPTPLRSLVQPPSRRLCSPLMLVKIPTPLVPSSSCLRPRLLSCKLPFTWGLGDGNWRWLTEAKGDRQYSLWEPLILGPPLAYRHGKGPGSHGQAPFRGPTGGSASHTNLFLFPVSSRPRPLGWLRHLIVYCASFATFRHVASP